MQKGLILLSFLFCLLVLVNFLQPVAVAQAAGLPSGFKKTALLTQGLSQPVALAQSPDGRIFILEKTGTVKIYKNGALLATPFLDLTNRVNSDYERGLLGIAFDPNFTSNGFVYLFYVNNNPLEIHVSRFTASGDTASPASEMVLLKSTQALSSWHHSGTLRIGPDGKLWISVGNNNNNDNSQDLSNIHGKILRINLDGSIPSDNPFVGQANKQPAIWAYGFRNPFRFNFMGSKPIVGDVGNFSYEEVDLVEKGANYGWPTAEGPICNVSPCPYKQPFFSYPHVNGASSSITGGFVYKANTGSVAFPSDYTNSYFYGDYPLGFIHRLVLDASGNFVSDQSFDDNASTVVDLTQGQDGGLYFVTIAPASLQKISYTTADLAPVAMISASPTAGLSPLSVKFSSDGSYDPQGKTLTYAWNFGDGTASTEQNPTHIYNSNGTYTAALTVSNGSETGSTISFPIHVGVQPPVISSMTPADGTKYNAGDTINYAASASDAKDGSLPASAYNWTIVFHHGTHTHPFLTVTGKSSGSFVIPTTGEASADTYYELTLTVTDSQSVSTTKTQYIYPNKTKLTFEASPSAALQVTLDGNPYTMPYTTDAVVGFQFTADIPTPQTVDTTRYDYLKWSDGGAKTHVITAAATPATYSATFTPSGTGLGSIHFRVREFDQNGKWTGKFLNGVTAKLLDPTGGTVYQTVTSGPDVGQDGWVRFDNVTVGRYSVVAYQQNWVGTWLQTDCSNGSTMTNTNLRNVNTENIDAGWQREVTVSEKAITFCKDIGIMPALGNLYFKAWLMGVDTQTTLGYGRIKELNGITAKLTDPTGTKVIQTVTTVSSDWGTDGWAFIKNVPPGTYGIMLYGPNLKGFWRQTDCQGTQEINQSINNANTEGMDAAWNPNVTVVGGTTTYCYDLGLLSTQTAKLRYRIKEFDANGNFTGKYLNDVTVKLTDSTGNKVYQTTTSFNDNGADGWVHFDNVPSGHYGMIAYKTGTTGYWKQTDCGAGGTTTGATLQNANTAGILAGFQTDISAVGGTYGYCKDIGLTNPNTQAVGKVHYRVREFDGSGNFTGKFLNGVTAKLTDTTGATVYQTTTSKTDSTQDGWVFFDNVDIRNTYGIITYQTGLTGIWKQTTCAGAGTTSNATIQNANTENTTAVFQTNITVTANQISFCKDAGLSNATITAAPGMLKFRVKEFDTSNNPTGKFINGATVKLVDLNMSKAYQIATSSAVNSDDGWVQFLSVPAGNYSALVFKDNMDGVWRQTDCGAGGTTDNASVSNSLTENHVAAKQENIQIQAGSTTYCKDVGLKNPNSTPTNGTLMFRVRQYASDGTFSGQFVNGATVKLTNSDNTQVIATATSAAFNNQDGWVSVTAAPGTYHVLIYKTGLSGYWKQTDCGNGGTTTITTVQNSLTENQVAVQQEATLTSNQIAYCKDAGLR